MSIFEETADSTDEDRPKVEKLGVHGSDLKSFWFFIVFVSTFLKKINAT